MIEFNIDDQHFNQSIRRLIAGVNNPGRLMTILAADMQDEVEENFAAEGRPAWAGLSPTTLSRRKGGAQGAKILQDTGQLAASITTYSDNTTAMVGTNKVYAAMMQFGGTKSQFPNLWGDIPARPFLVITEDGQEAMLSHTSQYLNGLIR